VQEGLFDLRREARYAFASLRLAVGQIAGRDLH
jgi:hypothetical protein